MWWMAMGCAQGPLELPRRVEVVVQRTEDTCEERSSLTSAEPVRAEVTNRSGDERVAEVSEIIGHVDEAEQVGFVVLSSYFRDVVTAAGIPDEYAKDAALGDGVTVVLEVEASVYCDGGTYPEAGRYVREQPIVSTDTLGGDAVEQVLEVVVRVE